MAVTQTFLKMTDGVTYQGVIVSETEKIIVMTNVMKHEPVYEDLKNYNEPVRFSKDKIVFSYSHVVK